MFDKKYDVIVVGGGHAGAEAAAAAANMGSSTLLVTMNLQTIGQMSCNPAMGGIAKGQIVREIDALGGYSGIVTDKSAQLADVGFDSGRMKTGTPPRVDGRSLDYEKMIPQPGDKEPERFSYLDTPLLDFQRDCHMTHTSNEVHDLLREGFDRSPMFNGRIKSIGPRYCPSIEDKIHRFADKDSHQIFVEPEGWNTVEVYVNGFSTSLPEDVQFKALRSVKGFKNVKFFRPGYAIEYDYFPPTQLKNTLET